MPIADWLWRNSKVGIDSNCDEAGKNDPDCRAVGRSEYLEGQVKVAFIQKGLVNLSFLQKYEPNYFLSQDFDFFFFSF